MLQHSMLFHHDPEEAKGGIRFALYILPIQVAGPTNLVVRLHSVTNTHDMHEHVHELKCTGCASRHTNISRGGRAERGEEGV